MPRPRLSPYCDGDTPSHDACQGFARPYLACTCSCHEPALPKLVKITTNAPPLFETIGVTTYDAETDTVAPVVRLDTYTERALTGLNPPAAPRMFGLAFTSKLMLAEIESWCQVALADVGSEVGVQLTELAAAGHIDISVEITELPF